MTRPKRWLGDVRGSDLPIDDPDDMESASSIDDEDEEVELTPDQSEFVEYFTEDGAADILEELGYTIDELDKFEARTQSGRTVFELEFGRAEWIGFRNSEDAEIFAIDQLVNDLEVNKESFTELLSKHISMTPTDQRMYANDEAENRESELNDKEVLERADELGQTEEEKTLSEKYDDAEENGDNVLAREILNDARDAVHEAIYDEVLEQLDDPVRYFVETVGIYSSAADMVGENLFRVDYAEAARAAVEGDGVANILASYDSEEREALDGSVWYRRN